MKQAVILAAGLGSRLTPSVGVPKPLVPVGGKALILWALQGAERAGCEEAILVLGYCGDQIQEFVQRHYVGPLRCRFVLNPDFERQNGISVLAASAYVRGAFLLLMADHFVEGTALERFRKRSALQRGALLVVDSRLEQVLDREDATKVRVQEGMVVDIGKDLTDYNAVDTGIFEATPDLIHALEQVVASHGDASLTDGVRLLARHRLMWAEELGPYFWQDVDTPEAYAEVQRWIQRKAATL